MPLRSPSTILLHSLLLPWRERGARTPSFMLCFHEPTDEDDDDEKEEEEFFFLAGDVSQFARDCFPFLCFPAQRSFSSCVSFRLSSLNECADDEDDDACRAIALPSSSPCCCRRRDIDPVCVDVRLSLRRVCVCVSDEIQGDMLDSWTDCLSTAASTTTTTCERRTSASCSLIVTSTNSVGVCGSVPSKKRQRILLLFFLLM